MPRRSEHAWAGYWSVPRWANCPLGCDRWPASWSFDQDKIVAEKLFDGCYIVSGEVPKEKMAASEVVASYKKLGLVEEAFRSLKTVQLEVRPVYHKTDDRIRSHVFLCTLASHPISESELENAVNWYFSVDNINAASDRVLQLTDRLELPKLLRHTPDRSHTSSDGQKSEVRVDSLNANHSFKYFGKEQGVSVYTFRDERDLLWHSLVFSAADRESAYVIDGLMHNDVVKSDIHSTDAFGYSEAIFGTSHLVGVSYAPRFKNLKRQRLYIFRSRQHLDRSEWKIKPTGYCDEESIIQFWDDILRFIATIKLKETTASDIFRRLNSYSKQHGLYHALKAFGEILKSIFILRVIDEPVLRMSIEKVLSAIEHVHAFTRAVSIGNPREFLQAEKEDQEMAEACKRLIKNCIICWNTCICRRNSPRSIIRPNGRNCCRPWPTGRRPPGGI